MPANLLYDLSNRANTSLSQRLLTVSSLPTTPYRGMIREYQITVPPVMRSKTTFIHFGADLQPITGQMALRKEYFSCSTSLDSAWYLFRFSHTPLYFPWWPPVAPTGLLTLGTYLLWIHTQRMDHDSSSSLPLDQGWFQTDLDSPLDYPPHASAMEPSPIMIEKLKHLRTWTNYKSGTTVTWQSDSRIVLPIFQAPFNLSMLA